MIAHPNPAATIPIGVSEESNSKCRGMASRSRHRCVFDVDVNLEFETPADGG
jgi:hypothetical protein